MDGELGTPASDQRARRVEASGRARRMLPSRPRPPSPQLTRLWEGAEGPIQETGQHARVSGQTMSCLSQAAVPGAGCAPEDAPSAVSRPSTPPVPPPTPAQLRVQPTPPVPEAQRSRGGRKAPCGAKEHPRLALDNSGHLSEAAMGDRALQGLLYLMAHDTTFPSVFFFSLSLNK